MGRIGNEQETKAVFELFVDSNVLLDSLKYEKNSKSDIVTLGKKIREESAPELLRFSVTFRSP